MATQAYLDFLEKPEKETVLLAHVEPKESLSGWTLTSGRTNTYEISWSKFAATNIINAGLFRQIRAVVQEGTSLTEQSSINDVENNSGSWYYDSSAEIIYVHTTDSVNPDDKEVVFVKFRLHFSTKSVVFNDIFYEPRILGDTEISVSEETEDLFFGEIKKVAAGRLHLNNTDALFDVVVDSWAWKNATVTILFGGDDLSFSDYEEIGQFKNENLAPGRERGTLFLRDSQKVTFRDLPPNIFDDDDFSNLDQEVLGSRIPLLVGAKSNITPILIDDTEQNGVYLIADSEIMSLSSIDAVYNDGAVISSSDITEDLSGCRFTIKDSFSGQLGNITCDAKGPAVEGKSWETSTDYLKFYGEIVSWIYSSILGLPESDIDSSEAKSVDAQEPIAQALFIDEKKGARSYIRDFERSVLGRTIRTPTGQIRPTLFVPGGDTTSLRSVTNPDIAIFNPDPKIETIFSRIFVLYDEDPTNKFSLVVKKLDNVAKYLHLDGRDEDREIQAALIKLDDATTLAERVRFISRSPDIEVDMVETGTRLMDLTMGDRLLVTTSRAPSSSGEWEDKVMEIKKIVKTFSPAPEVSLLLNDLKGVGSIIGFWTEDSANDWSNADSTEKSQNGFWTDDDGRIDPSSPSTEGIRVWW